ncbi:conserved protein of unknown function [Tenacibaculum sp. 190524A02b]|uniref:hypothetical protein n=1 Tax=Tenacibaculum vairaonense TaxID=3137860 RepID=UPI0032B1B8E5
MKITDISQEITWTKEKGLRFLTKEKDFTFLNEYLSNQNVNNIDSEIIRLKSFKEVMMMPFEQIENYIVNELEGFNIIKEKVYAHIAGAHNFTISVLYEVKTNSIVLKPPYFEDTFKIEIDNLLTLLEKTKYLLEVFND